MEAHSKELCISSRKLKFIETLDNEYEPLQSWLKDKNYRGLDKSQVPSHFSLSM